MVSFNSEFWFEKTLKTKDHSKKNGDQVLSSEDPPECIKQAVLSIFQFLVTHPACWHVELENHENSGQLVENNEHLRDLVDQQLALSSPPLRPDARDLILKHMVLVIRTQLDRDYFTCLSAIQVAPTWPLWKKLNWLNHRFNWRHTCAICIKTTPPPNFNDSFPCFFQQGKEFDVKLFLPCGHSSCLPSIHDHFPGRENWNSVSVKDGLKCPCCSRPISAVFDTRHLFTFEESPPFLLKECQSLLSVSSSSSS